MSLRKRWRQSSAPPSGPWREPGGHQQQVMTALGPPILQCETGSCNERVPDVHMFFLQQKQEEGEVVLHFLILGCMMRCTLTLTQRRRRRTSQVSMNVCHVIQRCHCHKRKQTKKNIPSVSGNVSKQSLPVCVSSTGSSTGRRRKQRTIPTNDELLYDPDEDDRDQAWVDARRRR